MRTKHHIALMALAAGVLAATSCSDFDDYNSVPVDATASANQTLWENISQNSELSDFAALVKRAGFADELSAAHYYTVWAPKNGTYDAAALMQKDSATLLRQFVKNHIAEYNHTLSGTVQERIHTLNEKSYDLTGAGTYTFGDVKLAQPNLPSSNGTMHLLDGMATFYPNLYEFLDEATGVDSLRSYLKTYEFTRLDPSKSVLGPVVNGKQTYIDSVMVTTNTMLRKLGAYIDREDSSYTMLMPSNKAWTEACNRIKSSFRYIGNTMSQDIKNATSATKAPELTATVDPAYMTDSITRLVLMGSLVFNNRNAYNRWVEDAGQTSTDTILTTGGIAVSNPTAYLGRTTLKQRMSNGFARLADSLAVHSWDGWARELALMPTTSTSRTWNGTGKNFRLDVRLNDSIATYHYLQAVASSPYAKPQVDVLLPGVMSVKYNIYAVLVPAWDEGSAAELKPNQLDFSLSYCNAAGKLAVAKLNQKVENDPTRVDTVAVGTFTFPVCYAGLPNAEVMPHLKITTDFNVFNKPMMAKYTRDIRLAGLILRPAELEEYEATK